LKYSRFMDEAACIPYHDPYPCAGHDQRTMRSRGLRGPIRAQSGRIG